MFWRFLFPVCQKPTCDQTGDDERQHQHLQHPHEQLSRERQILDLPRGEFSGPYGEAQDYACTARARAHTESNEFNLKHQTVSLTQSHGGDGQQNKQVSLEETFGAELIDGGRSLHLFASAHLPPEVSFA